KLRRSPSKNTRFRTPSGQSFVCKIICIIARFDIFTRPPQPRVSEFLCFFQNFLKIPSRIFGFAASTSKIGAKIGRSAEE
ncbi:MAG: hypothetical protein IKK39_16435, partial [Thermoguttaceae bacterium]|nr:hypothetical protein [Thermoguttaceae bacterium]